MLPCFQTRCVSLGVDTNLAQLQNESFGSNIRPKMDWNENHTVNAQILGGYYLNLCIKPKKILMILWLKAFSSFSFCHIWSRAKNRVQVPDDSPWKKIKLMESRWLLERLTALKVWPNGLANANLSCCLRHGEVVVSIVNGSNYLMWDPDSVESKVKVIQYVSLE